MCFHFLPSSSDHLTRDIKTRSYYRKMSVPYGKVISNYTICNTTVGIIAVHRHSKTKLFNINNMCTINLYKLDSQPQLSRIFYTFLIWLFNTYIKYLPHMIYTTYIKINTPFYNVLYRSNSSSVFSVTDHVQKIGKKINIQSIPVDCAVHLSCNRSQIAKVTQTSEMSSPT